VKGIVENRAGDSVSSCITFMTCDSIRAAKCTWTASDQSEWAATEFMTSAFECADVKTALITPFLCALAKSPRNYTFNSYFKLPVCMSLQHNIA
jgi:hypothetical protein